MPLTQGNMQFIHGFRYPKISRFSARNRNVLRCVGGFCYTSSTAIPHPRMLFLFPHTTLAHRIFSAVGWFLYAVLGIRAANEQHLFCTNVAPALTTYGVLRQYLLPK